MTTNTAYLTVIARTFAGVWVYMSCHSANAATLTAADALDSYATHRYHQYATFAIVAGTIDEYLQDEICELHDVELDAGDARIPQN